MFSIIMIPLEFQLQQDHSVKIQIYLCHDLRLLILRVLFTCDNTQIFYEKALEMNYDNDLCLITYLRFDHKE